GIPRSGGDTLNMKRNLLSVALATATLMIATAAQAQDASATADRQAPPEETATPADDATELDRVTATGIRRGIEDAIDAQRTTPPAAPAPAPRAPPARPAPPAAPAPPADGAPELARVPVTGLRRGIEDAIEARRTSTPIVESVSAEDIGKLPDMSIADSLARLP